MEEDDDPKEWVAQVEPGILITFFLLPEGGNDLKRIRFSSDALLALEFDIEGFSLLDCHCMWCCREMFDKWQAQRCWAENYDKVMKLYNVQRFNRQAVPLPTPPGSEDKVSRTESAKESPVIPPLNNERPHNFVQPTGTGYFHQIPWIIILCNRINTMTQLHLLRHQNFPALPESRLRHHQSMALVGLVHQGRQIGLKSSLSVMQVTWKMNGLNRMNQGFTSLLEHFQAALKSLDLSDSAEKGLEKCMQGCGGKKTEPGYKNTTFIVTPKKSDSPAAADAEELDSETAKLQDKFSQIILLPILLQGYSRSKILPSYLAYDPQAGNDFQYFWTYKRGQGLASHEEITPLNTHAAYNNATGAAAATACTAATDSLFIHLESTID
ncbi:Protein Brevis radix-like 1 [Hibiscus syriacus]|uniref:Protein Brevis radix-like 1 n=1 Tax=Hibiscus syriacus TaxID=106335 RepID=A0A6A2ZB55_HIBSY|nr:Protein Brevis radix-like 1 [Hibiscus syriacus]